MELLKILAKRGELVQLTEKVCRNIDIDLFKSIVQLNSCIELKNLTDLTFRDLLRYVRQFKAIKIS